MHEVLLDRLQLTLLLRDGGGVYSGRVLRHEVVLDVSQSAHYVLVVGCEPAHNNFPQSTLFQEGKYSLCVLLGSKFKRRALRLTSLRCPALARAPWCARSCRAGCPPPTCPAPAASHARLQLQKQANFRTGGILSVENLEQGTRGWTPICLTISLPFTQNNLESEACATECATGIGG